MSICGLDFGTSNATLGSIEGHAPVLAAAAPHKRVHARLRHARKRVHARLRRAMGAVCRKAWTQNRENNPMQSRMGPLARSTRAALRPGHEKKNGPSSRPPPNLIPHLVLTKLDL